MAVILLFGFVAKEIVLGAMATLRGESKNLAFTDFSIVWSLGLA